MDDKSFPGSPKWCNNQEILLRLTNILVWSKVETSKFDILESTLQSIRTIFEPSLTSGWREESVKTPRGGLYCVSYIDINTDQLFSKLRKLTSSTPISGKFEHI